MSKSKDLASENLTSAIEKLYSSFSGSDFKGAVRSFFTSYVKSKHSSQLQLASSLIWLSGVQHQPSSILALDDIFGSLNTSTHHPITRISFKQVKELYHAILHTLISNQHHIDTLDIMNVFLSYFDTTTQSRTRQLRSVSTTYLVIFLLELTSIYVDPTFHSILEMPGETVQLSPTSEEPPELSKKMRKTISKSRSKKHNDQDDDISDVDQESITQPTKRGKRSTTSSKSKKGRTGKGDNDDDDTPVQLPLHLQTSSQHDDSTITTSPSPKYIENDQRSTRYILNQTIVALISLLIQRWSDTDLYISLVALTNFPLIALHIPSLALPPTIFDSLLVLMQSGSRPDIQHAAVQTLITLSQLRHHPIHDAFPPSLQYPSLPSGHITSSSLPSPSALPLSMIDYTNIYTLLPSGSLNDIGKCILTPAKLKTAMTPLLTSPDLPLLNPGFITPTHLSPCYTDDHIYWINNLIQIEDIWSITRTKALNLDVSNVLQHNTTKNKNKSKKKNDKSHDDDDDNLFDTDTEDNRVNNLFADSDDDDNDDKTLNAASFTKALLNKNKKNTKNNKSSTSFDLPNVDNDDDPAHLYDICHTKPQTPLQKACRFFSLSPYYTIPVISEGEADSSSQNKRVVKKKKGSTDHGTNTAYDETTATIPLSLVLPCEATLRSLYSPFFTLPIMVGLQRFISLPSTSPDLIARVILLLSYFVHTTLPPASPQYILDDIFYYIQEKIWSAHTKIQRSAAYYSFHLYLREISRQHPSDTTITSQTSSSSSSVSVVSATQDPSPVHSQNNRRRSRRSDVGITTSQDSQVSPDDTTISTTTTTTTTTQNHTDTSSKLLSHLNIELIQSIKCINNVFSTPSDFKSSIFYFILDIASLCGPQIPQQSIPSPQHPQITPYNEPDPTFHIVIMSTLCQLFMPYHHDLHSIEHIIKYIILSLDGDGTTISSDLLPFNDDQDSPGSPQSMTSALLILAGIVSAHIQLIATSLAYPLSHHYRPLFDDKLFISLFTLLSQFVVMYSTDITYGDGKLTKFNIICLIIQSIPLHTLSYITSHGGHKYTMTPLYLIPITLYNELGNDYITLLSSTSDHTTTRFITSTLVHISISQYIKHISTAKEYHTAAMSLKRIIAQNKKKSKTPSSSSSAVPALGAHLALIPSSNNLSSKDPISRYLYLTESDTSPYQSSIELASQATRQKNPSTPKRSGPKSINNDNDEEDDDDDDDENDILSGNLLAAKSHARIARKAQGITSLFTPGKKENTNIVNRSAKKGKNTSKKTVGKRSMGFGVPNLLTQDYMSDNEIQNDKNDNDDDDIIASDSQISDIEPTGPLYDNNDDDSDIIFASDSEHDHDSHRRRTVTDDDNILTTASKHILPNAVLPSDRHSNKTTADATMDITSSKQLYDTAKIYNTVNVDKYTFKGQYSSVLSSNEHYINLIGTHARSKRTVSANDNDNNGDDDADNDDDDDLVEATDDEDNPKPKQDKKKSSRLSKASAGLKTTPKANKKLTPSKSSATTTITSSKPPSTPGRSHANRSRFIDQIMLYPGLMPLIYKILGLIRQSYHNIKSNLPIMLHYITIHVSSSDQMYAEDYTSIQQTINTILHDIQLISMFTTSLPPSFTQSSGSSSLSYISSLLQDPSIDDIFYNNLVTDMNDILIIFSLLVTLPDTLISIHLDPALDRIDKQPVTPLPSTAISSSTRERSKKDKILASETHKLSLYAYRYTLGITIALTSFYLRYMTNKYITSVLQYTTLVHDIYKQYKEKCLLDKHIQQRSGQKEYIQPLYDGISPLSLCIEGDSIPLIHIMRIISSLMTTLSLSYITLINAKLHTFIHQQPLLYQQQSIHTLSMRYADNTLKTILDNCLSLDVYISLLSLHSDIIVLYSKSKLFSSSQWIKYLALSSSPSTTTTTTTPSNDNIISQLDTYTIITPSQREIIMSSYDILSALYLRIQCLIIQKYTPDNNTSISTTTLSTTSTNKYTIYPDSVALALQSYTWSLSSHVGDTWLTSTASSLYGLIPSHLDTIDDIYTSDNTIKYMLLQYISMGYSSLMQIALHSIPQICPTIVPTLFSHALLDRTGIILHYAELYIHALIRLPSTTTTTTTLNTRTLARISNTPAYKYILSCIIRGSQHLSLQLKQCKSTSFEVIDLETFSFHHYNELLKSVDDDNTKKDNLSPLLYLINRCISLTSSSHIFPPKTVEAVLLSRLPREQ